MNKRNSTETAGFLPCRSSVRMQCHCGVHATAHMKVLKGAKERYLHPGSFKKADTRTVPCALHVLVEAIRCRLRNFDVLSPSLTTVFATSQRIRSASSMKRSRGLIPYVVCVAS